MSVFKQKISQDVWFDTYKWETDTCPEDTFRRVAKAVAAVEKDPKEWEEKYYEILSSFKFIPGGRILSNAGTGLLGTTLINCFVKLFEGKNQDSIEGIYNALKDQARILKSEGGYGTCFNVLRPRGAYIKGIGSESPGPIEMMKLWDVSSAVITSGSGKKKNKNKGKNKIRKGAQMGTMSVQHPSIEEFITAKQTPGVLTKFNLSVLITNNFMEAVKNHKPWDLIFPDTTYEKYDDEWDGDFDKWIEKGYPMITYKTFNDANELWDLILTSTYNRNEPGILFIDRANQLNNLWWMFKYLATNPCLTGETLIAVADGRDFVSIKELAEKKEDVPVYCLDDKENIKIRYMRHPRITGYNQPIYKITLDDNSVIRTTGNHKFKLTSGKYKEVIHLKKGDSLRILTKFEASMGEFFKNQEYLDDDFLDKEYSYINNKGKNRAEHKIIAEFFNNVTLKKGDQVIHKDNNTLNNTYTNLKINFVSDLKKNNFENDELILGYTNDSLKEASLLLTQKLKRRFTLEDWQQYAKDLELPTEFNKWRNNHLNGIKGLSKWAAFQEGYLKIDVPEHSLDYFKKCLSEGYDCILDNDNVAFIKTCEVCGKEFISNNKESALCSPDCTRTHLSKLGKISKLNDISNIDRTKLRQTNFYLSLKFKYKKDILENTFIEECKRNKIPYTFGMGQSFNNFEELKEYASYHNHRVLKVELDGYEDVYNGTVDEYHNFFVGGFKSITKTHRKKFVSLNCLQCGEQFLESGASCVLAALNLTQYLTENDFDYKKLEKDIPTLVRFQDAINDITNFPLPEQKVISQQNRRIGIGYMGYGSSLYLLKKAYGSQEALDMTDRLCSFITNKIYQASSDLALEKGSFPNFDCEKYLNSAFIKQALTKETVSKIKKQGIRNAFLTTLAPTGNTGVLANCVSGGLEPVVSHNYIRTVITQNPPEDLIIPKNINWSEKSASNCETWKWVKEGDESILKTVFNNIVYKIDRNRGLTREEEVFDYAVLELKDDFTKDKDAYAQANKDFYGKTIFDLKVEDHINTLKVFAKYIDSSISKTFNVPNDYSYENFKSVYMNAYDSGTIKGVTTYRWGTMTSVLSTKDSKENKDTSERPDHIIVNHAPKRPKELECDIHTTNIKGEKWTILVGKLNGYPYEMFAGKYSEKLPEKGMIIKQGSKNYILSCDGNEKLNILKTFGEHGTYSYSKMLSHGVPIFSIVDMCDKMLENVLGFNKAMGRVLKKYIKEDELKFMKCPSCGSTNVVLQEGCILCRSCGHSKCS